MAATRESPAENRIFVWAAIAALALGALSCGAAEVPKPFRDFFRHENPPAPPIPGPRWWFFARPPAEGPPVPPPPPIPGPRWWFFARPPAEGPPVPPPPSMGGPPWPQSDSGAPQGEFVPPVAPVAPQVQPAAPAAEPQAAAPASGAPVILSTYFPSPVPADGQWHHGWISFTDPDGDVASLKIEIVWTTAPVKGKGATRNAEIEGSPIAGKVRMRFT